MAIFNGLEPPRYETIILWEKYGYEVQTKKLQADKQKLTNH